MTHSPGKTGLALALIWVFTLGAGSANGQSLKYGIFGGITASQVDGDAYRGFNKLGSTAGLFVNSYIEYNIYWQAEIKFVTRGVYKGPADNDQTLYKSAYYYVEIPLSVHYLVNEKFLVELGISPEVLLGTRYWDENGILNPEGYPDNRRLGLSVFAGVGYWISNRVMAGLRYTNSAIPFRDPQEWNNPQYRGYFHNVMSLSLAFRLGSGRSGT
jgi:hypothetical protein